MALNLGNATKVIQARQQVAGPNTFLHISLRPRFPLRKP
jgi:hypothetical protein